MELFRNYALQYVRKKNKLVPVYEEGNGCLRFKVTGECYGKSGNLEEMQYQLEGHNLNNNNDKSTC